MPKIQIVSRENNLIDNNSKHNRCCVEYFRKTYENVMCIDSKVVSYRACTLDEQIERYSKHITFWYIQLDKWKK